VDLGIALDGNGRLGQPAAVTAVAGAADLLGYGSVWCIGPWAATLVGAVVAVSGRVRIGVETHDPEAARAARTIAGERLLVVDRLPMWVSPVSAASTTPTGPVRIDAPARTIAQVAEELDAARRLGVTEVVVRLTDDPGIDDALAAYAELAELVEGPCAGHR
jgi:hypothetical protein